MYRVYRMYLQWRFLCGPQLNLRKLHDSYMWLIPNITPFILSNMFIGHWDMMDLVYIQHSSSCRVQFHLLRPEEISYYVSGVAVDRPIVPNKFDIPKFLMLLLCVLANTLYKGKI